MGYRNKIDTMETDSIMPSISVDCVLFGFRNGDLEVLLLKLKEEFINAAKEYLSQPENNKISILRNHIHDTDKHGFRPYNLLGAHIKKGKSIYEMALETVEACLIEKNQEVYLRQLGAFGEVDRMPINRVITIVYYSLLNPINFELRELEGATLEWHKLSELPELIRFDHREIIEQSLEKLREDIRNHPVGFYLLEDKFTLTELQHLYESILDTKLDTRNFRRKLQNLDLLKETGETQKAVSHRAAKLYTFDKEKYDRLIKEGFEFRL